MERTGVVIYHGFGNAEEVASYGRVVEQTGYDSLWVTERFGHEEAFSVLGVLTDVTTRISLGLGVANPYSRHLGMLTMAAVTIDRLSGGRFILGMGRSDREVVEGLMGLDYSHSFADLSNAVTALRSTLGSSDHGDSSKPGSGSLHASPTQPAVPVYMAAIGPRALRLAGGIADGVLLNTYSPIGYVRWAVGQVQDGARIAGRDPKTIDIACMMVTRAEQELDYRQMKSRICRHLFESRKVSEKFLLSTSLSLVDLETIQGLMAMGRLDDAVALVSDELTEEYYITGSYEKCAARVGEYRAAGVTNPLLLPRLEDLSSTLEGMARYL